MSNETIISTTSGVATLGVAQPNITFAMIKSDAFANGVDGGVLAAIRAAGFSVIRTMGRSNFLSAKQIRMFYDEHRDRPYFQDLYNSVSDDVMPMILELNQPDWSLNKFATDATKAEQQDQLFRTTPAVAYFRKVIGATDARKAEPQTIRARFGGHNFNENAPMASNAVHGSDSLASVLREIEIIFGDGLKTINSIRHGIFYLQDFDTTVEY